MFMFKASVFLQELKTFEPEILDICGKAIQNSNKDLDFIRIDSELFSKCKSESIDYAIMEKTDICYMISTVINFFNHTP